MRHRRWILILLVFNHNLDPLPHLFVKKYLQHLKCMFVNLLLLIEAYKEFWCNFYAIESAVLLHRATQCFSNAGLWTNAGSWTGPRTSGRRSEKIWRTGGHRLLAPLKIKYTVP